jgi:alkylated DNA repair protein (DNA oxidative demethylase)
MKSNDVNNPEEAAGVGEPLEGFSYVPGFLPTAEQSELSRLVASLHCDREKVRGKKMKRGYAQFGYRYVTAGRLLIPAPPWPGFLTALADRILGHCPAGTAFDQCIVTRYPVGAGIGWHSDAAVFADCIAAVSLGAEARLQLRPIGSKRKTCEVLAAPGSLYVLQGPARWAYEHRVVEVDEERYSFTFRRATGWSGR